ncbi:xylose isomerase-like protein [Aspergillus aurantiobrunneus]
MAGACTTEGHPWSLPRVESPSYTRQYAPDATVVLVGFPRAGKRTLGIIASVALRRRYVDFETEYITAHGLAQYRTVEGELGCVIVGLGEFAQDHPVIYLVTTSEDKFERFYQVGNTFFETCSNFEFFNLEESGPSKQQPSSLKLKETERVFVRFLHGIFGQSVGSLFSSDAFSASHTFALQISEPWLELRRNLETLDAGADAITLLIDLQTVDWEQLQCRLSRYIATLRMHSRVPIVVDVISAEVYPERNSEVLQMLLRLVPDALTCSILSDPQIIQKLNATKGHTQTIATNQSPEVYSLPGKAQELGFQLIRVTGESALSEDNLACIALRQSVASRSCISVIMYNTGILGLVPPGTDTLTSCFLSPKKRFTLVGQAIEHTLSPAMHNAAYSSCGLPHVYDALQASTLSHVHALLNDEFHGGLAISLPYKTSILTYLDDISPDARDINAVNTVVLERQHKLDGSEVTKRKGHNTDYIGVRNCVHKHLSPANAIRDGTTALIIGAGGMARAGIYACYQLGIRAICLYNRTTSNAEDLANYFHEWAKKKFGTDFQLQVIQSINDPWPVRLRLPTVVISCLPAQNVGDNTLVNIQLPGVWLQSPTGGVFLEVAYGPSKTPLHEQMLNHTSRGWIVVDGLSLLVEQGIAQYELFTKRPAPIHVMRRVIREKAARDGKMTYQPAIMSASLGRAWFHDLRPKISQAARAGFKGIEIFYEDLEYAARNFSQSDNPQANDLLTAADQIYSLCESNGLKIIGLQPFLFYEGLRDREQHGRLIEKMKLWLKIVKRLRTDMIQIPANFLPAEELVGDFDVIADDLREVAELGLSETPVVRFAYENLCWSTHVDKVERLWDVVRRVDRVNFGMCLDTFNITGRVWGDPAVDGGKAVDADAALARTMRTVVNEVDVAKVFYIQVVDAERMASPLVEGHPFYVQGQPARMSWSRNARTFMYERDRGAYLPVEEVARGIIQGLGYRGFVSMELFSRTMSEKGEEVPVEHAKRGIAAWRRLQERLQLV